jgi:hypothetical protein
MNEKNRVRRDADLPTEREIEGLFRLLGELDDPELPVSDVEADLIVRIAEQMPVADDEVDRGAQRLLHRLRAEGGPDPKAYAPEAGATAKAVEGEPRPSLYQSFRVLGKPPQMVAEGLRLNEEILIQLDQGRARRVPQRLLHGLAAALRKTEEEIRRCIAPAAGDVLPMAAHGRRGATRRRQEAVDFLTILETSSLSEDDKRHWREIVAIESAE